MKKLMTLMLGLAFLSTTVALTYGQETKDTSGTTKKKGSKKSKKNTKTDETKG
jgi:hypothetical protein